MSFCTCTCSTLYFYSINLEIILFYLKSNEYLNNLPILFDMIIYETKNKTERNHKNADRTNWFQKHTKKKVEIINMKSILS